MRFFRSFHACALGLQVNLTAASRMRRVCSQACAAFGEEASSDRSGTCRHWLNQRSRTISKVHERRRRARLALNTPLTTVGDLAVHSQERQLPAASEKKQPQIPSAHNAYLCASPGKLNLRHLVDTSRFKTSSSSYLLICVRLHVCMHVCIYVCMYSCGFACLFLCITVM